MTASWFRGKSRGAFKKRGVYHHLYDITGAEAILRLARAGKRRLRCEQMDIRMDGFQAVR